MACGLLEMADAIEGEEAKIWRRAASQMVGSLVRDYSVYNPEISNGQILHGTYSKRTEYNTLSVII